VNSFTEWSLGPTVLDWTCYYGVGDGFGEAASVAGDGVGAVVSTVEGGAAGAGKAMLLSVERVKAFARRGERLPNPPWCSAHKAALLGGFRDCL
jgi:hypothetical protein